MEGVGTPPPPASIYPWLGVTPESAAPFPLLLDIFQGHSGPKIAVLKSYPKREAKSHKLSSDLNQCIWNTLFSDIYTSP